MRKLDYHCHLFFNECQILNNFFAVLPTVQPDKIDRFFIGFERNSNDRQHFRPHHDRGTGAHRYYVWRRKANAPHPVYEVFCLGVIYFTFIENKKSMSPRISQFKPRRENWATHKTGYTSRHRDQDHRVSMMDSQVIGVLFVVLASAAFSSAIRKFFSLLWLVPLKRPLLF